MHSHKILNIPSPQPALQETFAQELSISKILAQVLLNRGMRTPAQAGQFFGATIADLIDPFTFSGMPEAVRLIKRAAAEKKRALIFGDYDVDGITALTLIKNTLADLGLDAVHYLPHRVKEGYGLNRGIIELARQKNVKLLITADCGTSSREEVAELKRSGVETIITDHHEPSADTLPDAAAIINPKVASCGYAFKELAGVGVAYKLCQALTGKTLAEELDLVCLGTIADVVPLTGENRIIVREGLRQLSRTKKTGLRALMESARIAHRTITAGFVSYILGPRINASGRMASAEVALKLLLSDSGEEAQELARTIESYNRERQKVEGKIMEEAQDLINREVNFKEHTIIVVAKEGWHQGVLGIVASKLADKFYRPTILISIGEEHCKGSGRSIKNFHLFHALSDCRQQLSSFGGHSHAVGLVIAKENIDEFRMRINALAKEKLRLEDLLPSLEVDMELGLADISEKLIDELARLEPYGTGNPEPLFYTRGLELRGAPQVLARDTLKFWVSDQALTYPVIGFGMGRFKESLETAGSLELVYTPGRDTWKGEGGIILEAKDIFLR